MHAVGRSPLVGLRRLGFGSKGWCRRIVGPLNTAPVHESGTNPGGKQHRGPTGEAEFRRTVPKANAGIRTKGEVKRYAKGRRAGKNVKPAEGVPNPGVGCFQE